MKRFFLIIITFLFFYYSGVAQYKLIEEIPVDPHSRGLFIPYNKYQFDNGLRVLLIEDHSDPLVHVRMTYENGSASDRPDISGVSYFIFKLLQEGTPNMSKEDFNAFVFDNGLDYNAVFHKDYCEFSISAPAVFLNNVLWLESDRLANSWKIWNDEKFNSIKEEVLKEITDNENNVDALSAGLISRHLYPVQHPYNRPEIGNMKTMSMINLYEIKEFFNDWYGSNNMIMTISGDIEIDKTLKMISQYFSELNAAKIVNRDIQQQTFLDSTIYRTIVYNEDFSRLKIVYPTVGKFHPEEKFLNYMCDYFNDKMMSVMYRNFKENDHILDMRVHHNTYKHGGYFEFDFDVPLGIPLPQIVDFYKDIINRYFNPEFMKEQMEKEGREFNERYMDLPMFEKYVLRDNFLKGDKIETNWKKASVLSSYELFKGSPNTVFHENNEMNMIPPLQIVRVFDHYVSRRNPLIISMVPEDRMELIAGKTEGKFPKAPEVVQVVKDIKELAIIKSSKNVWKKFPRLKKSDLPVITPYVYRKLNDNGLRIIVAPIPESRNIEICMRVIIGPKKKLGSSFKVSELFAALFNFHLNYFNNGDLMNQLQEMGVFVGVESDENDLIIRFNGPQEMVKGSLMLFNEFFLQSNFSQQTYYYAVHELVGKYGALQISASELAANLAQNAFKSRQMYKDEADKDDFAFIKENSEFIKRNFDLIFCPERAIVNISGAVDTNDMEPLMEPFRIWLQPEKREKKPVLFDSGDSLDFENPGIYVLDTKKDKEARIVSTWYDIPLQDDFRSTISAEILDYTMGKKYNSILDQYLGEKEGFHDWESHLYIRNKNTMFQIEAGYNQQADVAMKQLDQIFANIDYKKIKRKDYKKIQRAFLNTKILNYESAEQKAHLLYSIVRYNWDEDYFQALKKAVKKTKKKSLNAFITSFLIDGSHFYLLSGDMDAIMKSLAPENTNEIVEIDKFGRLKID